MDVSSVDGQEESELFPRQSSVGVFIENLKRGVLVVVQPLKRDRLGNITNSEIKRTHNSSDDIATFHVLRTLRHSYSKTNFCIKCLRNLVGQLTLPSFRIIRLKASDI